MKRKIFLGVTVLLVAMLVTPAIAHAKKTLPPTPPTPPDEGDYYGARCNLPGILVNDSSKTVVVVGDLPGASRVWVYYWLSPGQVSNRDTNPRLCDADWFTYQHAKFIVQGQSRSITVRANHWAPYMYNRTYRCVDYNASWGATVKCSFVRQNWGEQN